MDTGIDGLGEFTGGVIGTGQEPSKLSALDDHRAPAFFAPGFSLLFLFLIALHFPGIPAFGVGRTG